MKGKCSTCGKQGHKASDFWEKEENAGKRPKNWKSSLDPNNETNLKANDGEKSTPTCQLCNKKGHSMKSCFYNPFNPKNRLKDPDISNVAKEDGE